MANFRGMLRNRPSIFKRRRILKPQADSLVKVRLRHTEHGQQQHANDVEHQAYPRHVHSMDEPPAPSGSLGRMAGFGSPRRLVLRLRTPQRQKVVREMGFRFRRSMKIAPGIRLNLTKTGVGISAGVRGARVSVHSSGRTTTTAGLPGTGLSWVSTGIARSTASRPGETPWMPTPGRLSPKSHRVLWDALNGAPAQHSAVRAVAVDRPDVAVVGRLLAGIAALAVGDVSEATGDLEAVVADPSDPADHSFVTEFLVPRAVTFSVEVAPGVVAALPLGREAATLALAELRQREGRLHEAVSLVEDLEPTTLAGLSLAELYLALDRYEDVIELTDGVRNEDEASALLCVLRGEALRAAGNPGAAVEAFKEAVRLRSRPAPIRHRALAQRAAAYQELGRVAQARRDLEKILAEDARYPDVRGLLAALSAGEAIDRPGGTNGDHVLGNGATSAAASVPDDVLAEREYRRLRDSTIESLLSSRVLRVPEYRTRIVTALGRGELPKAVGLAGVTVGKRKMAGVSLVVVTDVGVWVLGKKESLRLNPYELTSVTATRRLAGASVTVDGPNPLQIAAVQPPENGDLITNAVRALLSSG